VSIRLRDTLSGEVRPLEPLEPGHVRIYSCGPTVYGPTHIGNFRSFLFADVLVRYLRYRGIKVTWVMNITDIDDRIIARANAAGEPIGRADRSLARTVQGRLRGSAHDPARRPAACHGPHPGDGRDHRDAAREGARLPDRRRFDLLPDQLLAAYGKLARLDPEQLASASESRRTTTARTTCATSPVEGPKPASRRGTPGRAGRPGWHIECSAMSMKHLGESFDIHTGGST
jgi:cysteinyl-tRNA synthetase